MLVLFHERRITNTVTTMVLQAQYLFRNDGIHDETTRAPAPEIFLLKLRDEFLRCKRDQAALTLLSVKAGVSEEIQVEELIALARHIEKNLRSDEFYTRISETGFWIVVRGDSRAASVAKERFLEKNNQKWRTSFLECTPSMTIEDFISSADRVHFTKSH